MKTLSEITKCLSPTCDFSPFFSIWPLKTNFHSSFKRLIHFTQHSKMCASQKCQIGKKQLHQFKPIFNPIIWFAIFCNILFHSLLTLPRKIYYVCTIDWGAQVSMEIIKILGAILDLPAKQHCPFSLFGPFSW